MLMSRKYMCFTQVVARYQWWPSLGGSVSLLIERVVLVVNRWGCSQACMGGAHNGITVWTISAELGALSLALNRILMLLVF